MVPSRPSFVDVRWSQGAAREGFLPEGGQAGAKGDHSTDNTLAGQGTVLQYVNRVCGIYRQSQTTQGDGEVWSLSRESSQEQHKTELETRLQCGSEVRPGDRTQPTHNMDLRSNWETVPETGLGTGLSTT